MDFSHYSDEPVKLAVDLVNTYNNVSGNEALHRPEDILTLVESSAATWDDGAFVPSQTDLEEVKALRSKLRAVFDAENETVAAEVLNEVLTEVAAVPRISVHGEGPHLHFETSGTTMARWLGAITAMGLTTALIEGGFDRFGTCDSKTCDDVYVDTSRNRSRRNCSEKCTTRENVAAYRSRQTV